MLRSISIRWPRLVARTVLLAGGLSALSQTASADVIRINNTTNQESQAHDSISSFVNVQHTLGVDAAQWDQTTPATDSSAYGTSSATLVSALGQTAFDLDFSFVAFHRLNNSTWGEAYSRGTLYFTALQDLTYELSGSNAYSGGGAWISQFVTLIEDSTGIYLYDRAVNTTSASLTLTGPGLTGSLVAGRNYRLIFDHRLAHNLYNQTRSGGGNLTLSFNAVPEPGTAVSLAAGLLALAVARRR